MSSIKSMETSFNDGLGALVVGAGARRMASGNSSGSGTGPFMRSAGSGSGAGLIGTPGALGRSPPGGGMLMGLGVSGVLGKGRGYTGHGASDGSHQASPSTVSEGSEEETQAANLDLESALEAIISCEPAPPAGKQPAGKAGKAAAAGATANGSGAGSSKSRGTGKDATAAAVAVAQEPAGAPVVATVSHPTTQNGPASGAGASKVMSGWAAIAAKDPVKQQQQQHSLHHPPAPPPPAAPPATANGSSANAGPTAGCAPGAAHAAAGKGAGTAAGAVRSGTATSAQANGTSGPTGKPPLPGSAAGSKGQDPNRLMKLSLRVRDEISHLVATVQGLKVGAGGW